MFLKLSKLSSMGVLEEEGWGPQLFWLQSINIMGVCMYGVGGGGGGQQASCLVTKQAVEFPQVLASSHN